MTGRVVWMTKEALRYYYCDACAIGDLRSATILQLCASKTVKAFIFFLF